MATTAPQNGDDLTFDAIGGLPSLTNDISGLTVHHLSFIGGTATAYTIGGNAISLTGGISDTAGYTNYLDMDVTLGADQTFSMTVSGSGGLRVAYAKTLTVGSHSLTISGPGETELGAVSGSGIIRTTSGATYLTAASPNFSGSWDVTGGTLSMIDDPTSQLGTAGVTVASGAQLQLNDGSEGNTYTIANPITIAGDGPSTSGALHFLVPFGQPDTINLTGLVKLTGDASIFLDNYNVTLSGKLDTNGHTLSKNGNGAYTNNAQGYDDDLVNAMTSQPVTILTPASTLLNSDSAVKESSLAAQDTSYNYPLGLVNYMFANAGASNQVTLTFVTSLTPSQVTARKYDPTTKTYTNVPGATIASTTLAGQAALAVTYTITDNGPLDESSATGIVSDPVGLGVVAGSSNSSSSSSGSSDLGLGAPNTGYGAPAQSNPIVTALIVGATISTGAGLTLLYRQKRIKNEP
jgi:hypothetical protein